MGSGAAFVNWDSDITIKGIGLVFGEVPNPRLQTVPRAEAWAPLMGLQALNLNFGCLGTWDTDATYVTSNVPKLWGSDRQKGPLCGVHGDVWTEYKTLVSEGSLVLLRLLHALHRGNRSLNFPG